VRSLLHSGPAFSPLILPPSSLLFLVACLFSARRRNSHFAFRNSRYAAFCRLIPASLRALAYVGTKDDLPLVEQYAASPDTEIRAVAEAAAKSIRSRPAQ
jgi:hypothetical protein